MFAKIVVKASYEAGDERKKILYYNTISNK